MENIINVVFIFGAALAVGGLTCLVLMDNKKFVHWIKYSKKKGCRSCCMCCKWFDVCKRDGIPFV